MLAGQRHVRRMSRLPRSFSATFGGRKSGSPLSLGPLPVECRGCRRRCGLHPVPQRVGHDPQQELEGSGQELRRHVIICRLLELYKPVLITDRVEADADDATWAKTLSSSPRRFFAVTAAQRLRALVPRDVLTGAVVARLAAAMTRPDQGRTDQ
jgi:hypothetical protein